jgi:hypothetical protein
MPCFKSVFYHRELRWLVQTHVPQMFLTSSLGGSVHLSNIHLTALSWDLVYTCKAAVFFSRQFVDAVSSLCLPVYFSVCANFLGINCKTDVPEGWE